MESERKITALRDASFSSYLSRADDNFVVKLTDPLQETSGIKSSMPEEGEISVFSAEKYFKMKLDDECPRLIDSNQVRHVHGKDIRRVDHGMKMKRRPGTPIASSEASWDGQTALLQSSTKSSSQNRQKKVNERWLFAGFPCNGSCSDKKSVYTTSSVAYRGIHGKESTKETIPPVNRNSAVLGGRRLQSGSRFHVFHNQNSEENSSFGSNRDDCFVLSTVNSCVQSLNVIREDHRVKVEEPRNSIEMFGSRLMRKEDTAMNRKLSVLTWDAIPKAQSIATASTTSQVYDDIDSDASSDLFEIENISGTSQPKLTKKTKDGMSCCMTPSEGSIEWRVVTASAADFSAVSDYDEKKVGENRAKSGLVSTARKSRPNGLLGCRSLKAIEVVETAYKRNEMARPMPVRKLETEGKVNDYNFL
ncbi:hypothetical protein K2173_028141 [Erythroxylum novogranatense]|uniref:Protein PHYTOCHROME KINASE SUBSTRATE 1-like n=1 Tax=Erythroxylum novogranatense TaxID=1862640 RepID=A0AAV8U4B5_9ROSI|nr:hypothetical protein K2173_028141 [Erythroxylum novogranatense]